MAELVHIEADAAARALNALPAAEAAQVDQHAAICPPCRDLLRETEETAGLLALAIQPARPPGRCKARLFEKVEREGFLERPTTKRVDAAAWARFAFGATAVILLTWNIMLQRDLARERMIAQTVAMDPQPSTLKPRAPTAPSAGARMFKAQNQPDAVLIIQNLPPAPDGKVYQIWVADEQRQQPMETFQTRQPVEQLMMHSSMPWKAFKWIMITVEDAGGSKAPSKNTVLFGDL